MCVILNAPPKWMPEPREVVHTGQIAYPYSREDDSTILHFTFYILNSIRFNPPGLAPPTDTNLVFTKHEKLRCSSGFRLAVQDKNGLAG